MPVIPTPHNTGKTFLGKKVWIRGDGLIERRFSLCSSAGGDEFLQANHKWERHGKWQEVDCYSTQQEALAFLQSLYRPPPEECGPLLAALLDCPSCYAPAPSTAFDGMADMARHLINNNYSLCTPEEANALKAAIGTVWQRLSKEHEEYKLLTSALGVE